MKKETIEQNIKEVIETNALEQYPERFIAYRVNKDDIDIRYVYQDKEEQWWNSVDGGYSETLHPNYDIYKTFAAGFQPYDISDGIHEECWRDAKNSFGIYYADRNHHGKRKYFEYCKTNGIDSEYISKLDPNIADTEKLLAEFEASLSQRVEYEMEKYSDIDPVTLKNYEYMLNEPYYSPLELGFTLEDSNHQIVSYFVYDYDCMVMMKPDDDPFVENLSDWGFVTEEQLFMPLQSGSKLRYMSQEMAANIIIEVHDTQISDYDQNTRQGIRKFLKYCKNHHIEDSLPDLQKRYLRYLYAEYKIPTHKQVGQER